MSDSWQARPKAVMTQDILSPQDFISLSNQDRVAVITQLGEQHQALGEEFAIAGFEYHRLKALKTDTRNYANEAAKYFKLQVEYDTLEHLISAMQSVVRIEWLGVYQEE